MPKSSAHAFMDLESVSVLPWVPRTTSAVSLRLFELDSSMVYVQLEKPEPYGEKEASEYIVSIFNIPCFFYYTAFVLKLLLQWLVLP